MNESPAYIYVNIIGAKWKEKKKLNHIESGNTMMWYVPGLIGYPSLVVVLAYPFVSIMSINDLYNFKMFDFY